jgi:hypothetical protein
MHHSAAAKSDSTGSSLGRFEQVSDARSNVVSAPEAVETLQDQGTILHGKAHSAAAKSDSTGSSLGKFEHWVDASGKVSDACRRAISALKALEALEDQGSILDGTDAVFLVGQAGVGKSLTLNFLAGREIAEMVGEDGMDHLDVVDFPGRVSSVGHGESKTKEIRAFRDASTVTSTGSKLAFCDTPGFEDTEGVDADLVNAVTITSAVRRPATVRLVVLISVKGLLAERNYYLKVIPELCNFLDDVPKHRQSVLVLFTHCGHVPDDMKKATQKTTALARDAVAKASTASADDKLAQNAPIFLQHVLDLIGKHKELLFLQPTESASRAVVEQLILGTPPIDNSEVALKTPLSEASITMLEAACNGVQLVIKDKIAAGQKIASFASVLSQFKMLSDAVDCSSVAGYYQDLVSIILEEMLSNCSRASKALASGLMNDVRFHLEQLDGVERLRDHTRSIDSESVASIKERCYKPVIKEIQHIAQEKIRTVATIADPSAPSDPIRIALDTLHLMETHLRKFLSEANRGAYQSALSHLASTLDHDESVASALIDRLHTEALPPSEQTKFETALRRLKFASTLHEHVSEARAQTFTRCTGEIHGLIGSIRENFLRELKASSVREDVLKRLLARLHTLVSLGGAYAPAAASALEGIRADYIRTCECHPTHPPQLWQ